MNPEAGLFAFATVLSCLNVRLLVMYYVHRNKYAIRRFLRRHFGAFSEESESYGRHEGCADTIHKAVHDNSVDAVGIIGDPESGEAAVFVFGHSLCEDSSTLSERARILEHAAMIIINSARKMREDAKSEAA